MNIRLASAFVLLCACWFGARSFVLAADAPPDILGIRPGMPVQEAAKILRAHDPKGLLTITQTTVPQLGGKPSPTMLNLRGDSGMDIISVQITMPPNAQVVWGVTRQLKFPDGKEQIRANLLKALRDKYGMESEEQTPRLFWFFKEGGGAVTNLPALKAQNCAGSAWDSTGVIDNETETRTVREGGSQLQGNHFGRPDCDSLTTVRALFQQTGRFGAKPDEIAMLTISVTDGALAARAKKATDDAVAGVDQDKTNKERQQRQQQAPPKL